jgi:glycosyltransferase involved in cell wall biosynthesis
MVVRHCVPREFAARCGQSAFPEGRDHLVILHGKFSCEHGTAEILRAVSLLFHTYRTPCRVILFRERTDLPAHARAPVERLASDLGITPCVDLRDPVSYRDMFSVMQGCDIGVIAYRRALGVYCMPNRIFEYMATGLPVVVPSYAEEMRRILDLYDNGVHCDTEAPEALARTMHSLWENRADARRLGRNGRQAFESGLNWETESRPLMAWIGRASASRP